MSLLGWMQKNTLREGPLLCLLILSLRASGWSDQKMMRFLYLNWNVKQHFYSLPILFMCGPRNWQDKISQCAAQFNFLPVRQNGLKRKAVFHSARTQKFIAKCIERCGQRASYHNLLPHRCAGMRMCVLCICRYTQLSHNLSLCVCLPEGWALQSTTFISLRTVFVWYSWHIHIKEMILHHFKI